MRRKTLDSRTMTRLQASRQEAWEHEHPRFRATGFPDPGVIC